MGVEMELKYRLSEECPPERILRSSLIREILRPGTLETVEMEANYYDTPDRILKRQRAGYRLRREGSEWVATLKWGGTRNGAMAVRKECNVPLEGDSQGPDISVFVSQLGREELHLLFVPEARLEEVLMNHESASKSAPNSESESESEPKSESESNSILNSESKQKSGSESDEEDELSFLPTEFEELLITRFTRQRAVLNFEGIVVELALDQGEIIAGEKKEPINELELELLKGDVPALVRLGGLLQKEFSLEPEENSKMKRGLILMGEL